MTVRRLTMAGGALLAAALLAVPTAAHAAATIEIDFSTGYVPGAIDGQNGWTNGSGAIDAEFVDLAGFPDSGLGEGIALRISNAVVNGVMNQVGTPLTDPAGQTDAPGATTSDYGVTFTIASATGEYQEGLRVEAIPDQTGNRLGGNVVFYHADGGLRIGTFWVPEDAVDTSLDSWESAILTGPETDGLWDPTVPHEVSIIVSFVDAGPDVVDIYVDGELVFSRTSWEYYHYLETGATPLVIDRLLFRANTSLPDPDGVGFLGGQPATPSTDGAGFVIGAIGAGADILAPEPAAEEDPALPDTGTDAASTAALLGLGGIAAIGGAVLLAVRRRPAAG